MATILEAVAADGAVQRLPMSAVGQTAVAAEPGYRYRLVDDAGGRVAASAQVKRIGGDLVVEGLEQDRSVVLEGFFTRCAPANDCALSLENLGGTAADAIVPATAPIGALSGGGFLMYASGAAAPAIPAPPEAGFDFKPILGVAGGLAIVGGAGGGGGGGGGSSGAPAPGVPMITSSPFTNDPQPLFTGTAQAGSTVTMTIGGVVTYSTLVGGNGNWQIDTATATPATGTLPTLVEGVKVDVVALAANADGRPGGSVNTTITLDLTPPEGPTISDNVAGIASGPITFTFAFAEPVLDFTAEDVVSGGTKGAFTTLNDRIYTLVVSPPAGSEGSIGVTVRAGSYTDLAGNANETETGPYTQAYDTAPPNAPTVNALITNDTTPAITGTASAGDLLTVTVNGVTYDESGSALVRTGNNWSLAIPSADALAEGIYEVVARLTDAAGNFAVDASTNELVIDTTAPTQIVTIGAIIDNAAPVTGLVANGGSTNDTTPALSGTLSGVLGVGELVEVLRNGAVIGTASVTGTNWTFTDSGLSNGNTYAYTARVADGAGNGGVASGPYTIAIDTTAPTQIVTIGTVTDNVAPVTGPVGNGGSTNDTTPTLSGTLSGALGAGEEVQVLRNGAVIGTAEVTGTSWTFSDSGLSNGNTYAYTARIIDAVGNQGAASTAYTITIDTAPPTQTVTISNVTDNVEPVTGPVGNGGSTNDTTPTLSGTLSGALGAGEEVQVLRNGAVIGTAEVTGTSWTFTDSGLSNGNTYVYTARVADDAGHLSAASNDYSITVDTIAPTVTITDVLDDVGPVSGSVAPGGTTDDPTPTLELSIGELLGTGTSLEVRLDNVAIAGTITTVDANTVRFTGSDPLPSDDVYTYTARLTDAAGNVGLSAEYSITFQSFQLPPDFGGGP